MTPARWFKDLRYRLFYRLLTRTPSSPLITLGDECQWTVDSQGIGPASKVLSAGAGNDISFEKALISSYGCRVVLLDPSPTGIATVTREKLPSETMAFLPVGLAGIDGFLDFQKPADAREGSFVGGATAGFATHRFACKTIRTLMDELGWTGIDLLKMDIEGYEFAVLEQIIAQRLSIRQICVEFHHGMPFGRQRNATARMILSLRRAGFDLVHRVHWDHTFLRRKD